MKNILLLSLLLSSTTQLQAMEEGGLPVTLSRKTPNTPEVEERSEAAKKGAVVNPTYAGVIAPYIAHTWSPKSTKFMFYFGEEVSQFDSWSTLSSKERFAVACAIIPGKVEEVFVAFLKDGVAEFERNFGNSDLQVDVVQGGLGWVWDNLADVAPELKTNILKKASPNR